MSFRSFKKQRVARFFFAAAVVVAGLVEPVQVQAEDQTALPYGPGVISITVEDDRQDRPLSGDLWYPTSTPEVFSRADKSKVWQMAPADPDGRPAEGRFPLLVISHGMYGNTHNQAWLASELSRRGYMVALINHPGTSTFLRDPDQAREMWDRPVDLSRLITFLLKDEATLTRIDPDRIYAAGHSLGGYTVMVVAGATFDPARQQTNCSGDNQPASCKAFAGWSVAETAADKQLMSVSRKDSRIRKVISLDLGGTPLLSTDSLQAVDIPVLVLGAERADMVNQAIESHALAASLPANMVHHVELEDAGHFDFMGVCKPEALDLLSEEEPGDEIVCVKGIVEREAQHKRILAEILDFLKP